MVVVKTLRLTTEKQTKMFIVQETKGTRMFSENKAHVWIHNNKCFFITVEIKKEKHLQGSKN